MPLGHQKPDIALDKVRVAHFDPNMRMRTLMRGMLLTTGFREIRECRSIQDIITLLETDAIDLLLIDIDTDTDDICKIVRDIREGRLGPDPYLVIMAMTWRPEQDMISRALQTGTDDLVAKPISTKVLAERTANLVHNRRDFVVTTTYVGPDRRTPDRHKPGDLPTIKVPNSLRFKAVGDPASVADVGALAAARETIKSHRVFRIAAEISDKALALEEGVDGQKRAKIPAADLKALVDKVGEINHLIKTEELDQLKMIGHSMTHVLTSIIEVGHASKRLLAVLRLHSQAIGATIKGDKSAAAMVSNALNRAVKVVQSVNNKGGSDSAAA
jgi:DNA-binding response OmpR family regulator